MNKYVGNQIQLYSVREARLVGGKGDGMRILTVKNGKGLEFTVSLDRAADISELSLKGDNFSFIAPCLYVAPEYYDCVGAGFLKSFTAGFLTTCGLKNVGNPCTDNGEQLPLHGTVSHIPAETFNYYFTEEDIHIKAVIRDAALFSQKLLLEREYVCSLKENKITLIDKVTNIGFDDSPIQMLYHCNMGYPLLSEDAVLTIPSSSVIPRNQHAATGINTWNKVESPQHGYVEMCYYHQFDCDMPKVSLYNNKLEKGIEISYNKSELPFFTQWKMMGEGKYVMGLEPGNCNPDGRDVMREKGLLMVLKPGESKLNHITFKFMG